MSRRLLILGSTGSIGTQALDVVHESLGGADPLHLVGLSAGSSWKPLLAQASAFGATHAMLDDPLASHEAERAAAGTGIQVVPTIEALIDATEPDLVLNAVVGFAGLAATVAALERGVDVALANKESLVAAGSLCLDLSVANDARIIPVDSEHSALLQCLGESAPEEVESLVLTASGGPFRGRTREQLRDVTVEEALAHPTWNMGGKISIDSATLMNKGLELVEAMVLFGMAADDIEVVVHPQSIVHSLVRHVDGSLVAHLGWPDMRVPIAFALHWPVRQPLPAVRRLELTDMPRLEFEEADAATFGCLRLARSAAAAAGGLPCVMNAANEVAVEAFLAGKLGFLDIEAVVEATMTTLADIAEPDSFAAAQELNARARDLADLRVASTTHR